MLTLENETNYKDVVVNIDEFVPFDITFGKGSEQCLYWRGGNGKSSLVEVGLNMYSGEVSNITLANIDSGEINITDEMLANNLPEIQGSVIFQTSEWLNKDISEYSNRFIDDFDCNIKLIIGSNYIKLLFKKATNPICYIINRNIRFGFSLSRELSTLEILDLNQEKLDILKLFKLF
ncbi:hypothetical protein [Escherichia coli]|uniref:hypothetical protein n=1 Tax=Escherichia coli TaxID=562 RepID=UPI002021756F|nr:hypothetical protein [Escherichia coli]